MDVIRAIKREVARVEGVLQNTGTPNIKILTEEQVRELIPDEINSLVDRIRFLVRDDVDRNTALEHVKLEKPGLVAEMAIKYAVKGRVDLVGPKQSAPLTDNQKAVFPYLLSQSSKINGELVGFSPKEGTEGSPMWFFSLGRNQSGVICVGYNGDPRQLDLSKISLAGYSQMTKPQAELKRECKASLPKDITPQDVRVTNFYVGLNTLPKSNYDNGKRALQSLVSSLPEIGAKSQLHNKDIPKI